MSKIQNHHSITTGITAAGGDPPMDTEIGEWKFKEK